MKEDIGRLEEYFLNMCQLMCFMMKKTTYNLLKSRKYHLIDIDNKTEQQNECQSIGHKLEQSLLLKQQEVFRLKLNAMW